MGLPGLKEVAPLFFSGESGKLLEDQSLTLAGFNARGDWFFRAKIALAHPSPFPVKGGDAKGTGQ
jgi:hypothetical protein